MATAAGGTVASLGETLIGKGHINKRDIAESVVSNVVSAGIGTGVGKIIEKGATKLTAKVANKYASSVVRQAFRKEVKVKSKEHWVQLLENMQNSLLIEWLIEE